MPIRRKRWYEDDEDEDEWRRRPFFSDFFDFEEIDEEFERMRRYMDSILERFARGEIEPKEGGPFVYGFSMRVGPDGKPQIQKFGNTRPSLPAAKGEPLDLTEREPLTDVIENPETVSITLEIPGVDKRDIDLNVKENFLTIDVDTPERKYHKEIPLPCEVKPESAKATYKNGVLDITLTKRVVKETKGKRIEIE